MCWVIRPLQPVHGLDRGIGGLPARSASIRSDSHLMYVSNAGSTVVILDFIQSNACETESA
jgi:hypothetical protein